MWKQLCTGMSAAEGPRLLTEPLVLNSHNTQVEVPAEKTGYVSQVL